MLNNQNPILFYQNLWLYDEITFDQKDELNKLRKPKNSLAKRLVRKYSLLFFKG